MDLQALVQEAKEVNKQVMALSIVPTQSPALAQAYARSAELEQQIKDKLWSGEHLKDLVLEYTFRRFARDGVQINNKISYKRSAFEVVPEVMRFMEVVAQFQGQKISSSYGPDIEESGIISGGAVIQLWSYLVHALYVPVENHVRNEFDYSQKMPQERLFVNCDFFYKGNAEMRDDSHTDISLHSDGAIFRHKFGGLFVGGLPKGDRVMYIGDKYVNRAPEELAKVEKIDTSCPGCKHGFWERD